MRMNQIRRGRRLVAIPIAAAAMAMAAAGQGPATAAPSDWCSARAVTVASEVARTYPGTMVVLHVPAATADAYSDMYSDAYRSFDIRIPNWQSKSGISLGDRIAADLQRRSRTLGVDYVLWNQTYRPAVEPPLIQRMEDRGSATANHADHLHVTILPGGARAQCRITS